MTTSVRVPIATQYYHFDQQGVAFNMWYLSFLEEARNQFLATHGFSLEDLLASGHDLQVVHVDVNWTGPARYRDVVEVDVDVDRVGVTSFALRFTILVNGQPSATASSAYVVIDSALSAKAELPSGLRTAIGGD